MKLLRLLLPIALLVGACSDSGSVTTSSPNTTAVTTTTTADTTTTLATTTSSTTTVPTTTTTTLPTTPLDEIDLGYETIADGFHVPILFTFHPVTQAPIVVDQNGEITELHGEERIRVLDLRSKIHFQGERGLLGFAFHPTDPERVFVHYTAAGSQDTVVAEYRWPSGADLIDPDQVMEILRHDQPAGNHNGGMIAFGPDGYLYIALGDGGGGNDPYHNGQNPFTLLGALLRLDIDSATPYAIPPENPFADGTDGAPEVFAWGLRNPWRFSFDGENIWIADVGQNNVEEIDLLTIHDGGLNFGWPLLEGFRCNLGTQEECARTDLTPPIHSYNHGGGRCSVTGGFVYRGSAIPDLVGTYLFADFCTGDIWGIRYDPATELEAVFLIGTPDALTSFGIDAEGELFILAQGAIRKLIPGD